MPVNDTTANKAYPKPNIANTLADDVGRLRTALDEIDADIAACSVAGQAVTVPAGSASAPSVSFTGDTNTGVFSPGGNQVALTTDGSTRLHIGSTGYIGVGSAPNDAANVLVYDATAPIVQFGNSTTGSTASDGTLVYQSGNNFEIFNQEAGSVTISTNSTQRLLIDASGNVNIDSNTFYVDATNNRVGIGTSSPGTALDVNGAIRSNDIFTLFKNGTDALYIGAGTIITGGASTDVAFRSNQNGSILFSTNGPTERMRLDASGRLGIGTTSPTTNLHVVGGGPGVDAEARISSNQNAALLSFAPAGTNAIRHYTIGSAVGGSLIFYDNTANSQRAAIDSSGRLLVGTSTSIAADDSKLQVLVTRADSLGGISLTNNQWYGAGTRILFQNAINSLGTITPVASITGEGDGANKGRLVFSVTRDGQASPTSAMRITNSGRTVVLGNTNAFDAYSEQGAGTSFELFIGGHSATTTAPGSGTSSFRVFTNGNVQNTNNSYGSLSDAKLKENIVDAGSQWNDLKSLQVRKYNFKEETGQQTHTQIGLIAQEVEQVSPGLVSESPDRDAEGNDLGTVTKSVNYSVLYMKAVKALQEAMERIEVLEQRLTDAGIA